MSDEQNFKPEPRRTLATTRIVYLSLIFAGFVLVFGAFLSFFVVDLTTVGKVLVCAGVCLAASLCVTFGMVIRSAYRNGDVRE